jgi:tetratricopeptide (TPR) repeat protein
MKALKCILIILLIGSATVIFAQRVDKEKVGIYQYVQLPSDITLVNFKTYKVDAKGMNGDAYRRDAIASNIALAGYDKIGSREDADFIVEVEEYPLRYGEPQRRTQERTVKVDGVEKKVTDYWYSNACNYKYVLHIFNKAGELLLTKEASGEDNIVGRTESSASKAWESYGVAVQQHESSVIPEKVSMLNSIINNVYCFPVKREDIIAGNVKAKKFDYSDVNAGYELLVAGFEIVRVNENAIDDAAVKFNEAITTFTKVLGESNLEDKKARIDKDITAMLYYNIAVSYFLMKDYTKAIENFSKAIEVKPGIFDAKSMREKTDELQRRVVINS